MQPNPDLIPTSRENATYFLWALALDIRKNPSSKMTGESVDDFLKKVTGFSAICAPAHQLKNAADVAS